MIIERYIAAEVLRPLMASATFLLVIFVGYSSAQFLTDAVNGLLPVDVLYSLILLKAAVALEVLLPIALYVSVVLGLGRLYGDSEITAMLACGIGLGRVVRVVFVVSLALALAVAGLSLYGRPRAYEESYWIRARADAQMVLDRLEGGRFFIGTHSGRAIFVGHVGVGGILHDVFLRDEIRNVVHLVRARRGHQQVDPGSGRRRLVLEDVRLYALNRDNTHDIIGRFGQFAIVLDTPGRVSVGYRRKAAPTLELVGSRQPEDLAELQWRISTPVSTVLLGLLGVVVGRSGRGRGRSRYGKMIAATLVYAAYYNVSALARTWVDKGVVPVVPGIWWVQVLFAVLLVFLFALPRLRFRRRRVVALSPR
ncbi:MAG: LPS export ABC transporter permease LptF [Gammaproteobacteria bacterium]|nr:LPS export ABC transporter permease LptF [Gammaproteobacteria bacterium]